MNTTKLYRLIVDNKEAILEPVYSELLGMVKEELAKEAEKQAGRKPIIRNAVKQFIRKDLVRPNLTVANVQEIDGVKYYGYCDGYKLAWSPIDFGFGVADESCTLNWRKIIEVNYQNRGAIPVTDEFKKELMLFIKTEAGKPKYLREPFRLTAEHGFSELVNPKYLKVCLDFTGATEIVIDLADNTKPLFFHGKDDRHAMCLPIRR